MNKNSINTAKIHKKNSVDYSLKTSNSLQNSSLDNIAN